MIISHYGTIPQLTDLSRILFMIRQSMGSILKLKIVHINEEQEQGSTNSYRIFVLKFIDHIIQGRSISDIVKIICNLIQKDKLSIAEFYKSNR